MDTQGVDLLHEN